MCDVRVLVFKLRVVFEATILKHPVRLTVRKLAQPCRAVVHRAARHVEVKARRAFVQLQLRIFGEPPHAGGTRVMRRPRLSFVFSSS